MYGVSKENKRRLRSIKNTRQITRAMEMVSAVKMRKSVQAVLASRMYSHTAWHILDAMLKTSQGAVHQFVEERDSGAIALVVVSGNRGLAGSFNGNIADAVVQYIQSATSDSQPAIITLGIKARDELIARGFSITADFLKQDVVTTSVEIESLISYLFTEYRKRTYRRVVLFYTDYESALKQTVRSRVLLPLTRSEDPYLGVTHESVHMSDTISDEYVFEPKQEQILRVVIPRILETQVFQAILESQASEHSARMLAMRNASEAASDMMSELQLEYNKQRQGSITQELAEIAASRMALSEAV